MRDKFINIGNKAFVNIDKVKYIVSADTEKVRRELTKRNLTRSHKEVFDATFVKETRSMLIFDDNSIGISSVSAAVLAGRANMFVNELTAKATKGHK